MTEENANIREYSFHVPGFIPGIPGVWPAGSRVCIDEDTKEILSVFPVQTEAILPEAALDASPPALETFSEPDQDAPAQQGG